MFERLFAMIRTNVKKAILGGIADAQAELEERIENHEPLLIEGPDEPPASRNGTSRRKAVAK